MSTINSSELQLPRPAPAHFKERTEFSITLFVPASASGEFYRFEYKQINKTWTSAVHVDSKVGDSTVLLDDLEPTSSYEIRIYAVKKDSNGSEVISPPSEAAVVDTEVPGCTPDRKCSVM